MTESNNAEFLTQAIRASKFWGISSYFTRDSIRKTVEIFKHAFWATKLRYNIFQVNSETESVAKNAEFYKQAIAALKPKILF